RDGGDCIWFGLEIESKDGDKAHLSEGRTQSGRSEEVLGIGEFPMAERSMGERSVLIGSEIGGLAWALDIFQGLNVIVLELVLRPLDSIKPMKLVVKLANGFGLGRKLQEAINGKHRNAMFERLVLQKIDY